MLLLALLLGIGAAPARLAADEVEPRVYAYAGLDHFYNVEHKDAIADFKKAIEGDPNNPFFHNYLANAYLFSELRRLGKLEGNLYDASNSFLKEKSPEPDPQVIAQFKKEIEWVKKHCEERLARNPRDVDALYALGAAYGMQANYHFTIEKKWFDALDAGGKANDLHEKVLKIDPNYHDAKLIPGAYQYVVGSIPRTVKWLAFLFGFRGSREKGIAMLQETMVHGKLAATDAVFLLAVVYNRERQYEYSRRLLQSLSEYFPRNPLVRLEIARTYVKEGQLDKALPLYTQVAKDLDAGKFGQGKVPRDRLWYQIGTLYQQRGQSSEALEAYAQVTDHNDSDGLVKAHAGLRRAEIFVAQNRLDRARAEYERVAAMPYDEPRRQAQERLRDLQARTSP
ncbi:MAG TPA: tetratricopeptide repeat protein [Candidatus Xenobia bacterium]|nr:tetratricopeptide repeat protein [Candidatus Xenobia bacterium]